MSNNLEYAIHRTTPVPRRTLARFIADNNPCYLLSAACMLLGLLTLANSLSFSPIPHQRLIALIATLNLYETVLIGLAIWLIARRKLMRDGEILLAIEALFIADGAMLSSEMFTADLRIGLIVNVVLLLLAIGKFGLVISALALPMARTLLPLTVLQAMVLGLPGLIKSAAEAHGGRLSPPALYGAWWMTVAIPILIAMVSRASFARAGDPWVTQRAITPARRVAITFAALAGISIIVHLSLASWIYKVAWFPAYSTPLLLGTAIAMMISTGRSKPNPAVVRAQFFLTSLAVLTSLATPPELTIGDSFPLTPLRLSLLGSAGVFAVAMLRTRRTRFALFALADLFLAALGSTVEQIIDRLLWPLRSASENSSKIVPQSSAAWGAIAVAFAFLFLAAGAMISIWKKPPSESEPRDAFSVAVQAGDRP